ncbi:MAG: PIG-L family deacetylase [Taibaiella sp.]|nr:PIG-L family deacetylase [Taibaiella sp.]
MRIFLLSLLLCLNCFLIQASTYDSVAFYVVAHPDDWQLFMGSTATHDLLSTHTKVVVIHTTAGDASCNNRPLSKSYYMARESGAINSLEYGSDYRSIHDLKQFKIEEVNGHKIRVFRYKDVVNYFLRLPDGCFKCGLNGESIQYLKENKISGIRAVDSTASYTNWEDLVNTVKNIIVKESAAVPSVWLNIPDTDEAINPKDHPDHIHTAYLGLEATKDLDYVNKNLYVDYHIANLAVNLSADEIAMKSALYAVADFGITQNNNYSTYTPGHINFLSRSYFRTEISKADSLVKVNGNVSTCNLSAIFPNPATTTINVSYRVISKGTVTINVVDMSGVHAMSLYDKVNDAGAYSSQHNISLLAPGNYLIVINTPSFTNVLRLVKQ